MNIYHVERTDDGGGYDTYSDFVCVAQNELEARKMKPGYSDREVTEEVSTFDEWVKLSETKATLIGKAETSYDEQQIICASYNAG